MCKRMRIEIHVDFTEMTNYGCQETCFYCALLTLTAKGASHTAQVWISAQPEFLACFFKQCYFIIFI